MREYDKTENTETEQGESLKESKKEGSNPER
jgi:hypothetical protein